jgi:leader peptidase (prepilin peptidase)/N-methyltransferase
VGAALGWIGWRALVEGTFLTFALAAIYGVALLLLRRASRTTQLPLGPFIVLGTLVAITVLPPGRALLHAREDRAGCRRRAG